MVVLRRVVIVLVGLAMLALLALWVITGPQSIPANALPAHTPNLVNGEELFNAGGCASCHAKPDGDRTQLSGGRALESPFGTFYVPNISSDPKDGIGNWTEAQFLTAMLKGTGPDGQHLYPSFPYASYQRMRVDDVRDLFAYLKTLPAVQGRVQDHDLPFPFNIRLALGPWKLLFLDGKPFQPDPSKSTEWNRGSYLVNGPGHCAECHSPRNLLGGLDETKRFAGGPNPEGEGWVPNITQKSLASWSEQDFADFLESGDTPDFNSVGGSMRPVIQNLSHLTPEDRKAMAVYLKSLSPIDSPPIPAVK